MKKQFKNNREDLYTITCPNDKCGNEFLIEANSSGVNLFCVKCGSKWNAKQEDTEEKA